VVKTILVGVGDKKFENVKNVKNVTKLVAANCQCITVIITAHSAIFSPLRSHCAKCKQQKVTILSLTLRGSL
jgi:hypothetical protein